MKTNLKCWQWWIVGCAFARHRPCHPFTRSHWIVSTEPSTSVQAAKSAVHAMQRVERSTEHPTSQCSKCPVCRAVCPRGRGPGVFRCTPEKVFCFYSFLMSFFLSFDFLDFRAENRWGGMDSFRDLVRWTGETAKRRTGEKRKGAVVLFSLKVHLVGI